MDLDQIRQLAIEYGNATFDCGEHHDGSSEPYEALNAKAHAALDRLMAEVTALGKDGDLNAFREWVEHWAAAYPLDVFPEPDFTRVREVLSAAGLSLDCVSASNMRHVITRVRDRLIALNDG